MGFTVDPEAIRAAKVKVVANAQTVAAEATTLAAKAEELTSTDGLNTPQAGPALNASIQLLKTNITALVNALDTLGTRMGTTATNYESADSAAGAAVKL